MQLTGKRQSHCKWNWVCVKNFGVNSASHGKRVQFCTIPAKISASSMKCVVRRTTLSLAFSCNKDHISRLEYGSIPLVGSSNITTFFIKQQQKNIVKWHNYLRNIYLPDGIQTISFSRLLSFSALGSLILCDGEISHNINIDLL